jgi:hypothetical protein
MTIVINLGMDSSKGGVQAARALIVVSRAARGGHVPRPVPNPNRIRGWSAAACTP